MLRASVLAILAGTALCGCAATVTPAQKLTSDLAVCRRHAIQGPGGPSSLVGDRSLRNATLNRNTVSNLSSPSVTESERESVYRECLETRGHSLPRGNDRPADPDTIGGAGYDGVPV